MNASGSFPDGCLRRPPAPPSRSCGCSSFAQQTVPLLLDGADALSAPRERGGLDEASRSHPEPSVAPPSSPSPTPARWQGQQCKPTFISFSLPQMEVVSTFKRSASFQGAVRRRSSVLSQLHDVTNLSTPTHAILSAANPTSAAGSES